MKWVLIGIVVVVGLFCLFITIAVSPMERELSTAANDTASQVLGANYSQFGGMPELFNWWWILPIITIFILVLYIVYKLYKK